MPINTDTPTLEIELPKHMYETVSHLVPLIPILSLQKKKKTHILTLLRSKTETINKAIKLASRHHRFLPVITEVHQSFLRISLPQSSPHVRNAHPENTRQNSCILRQPDQLFNHLLLGHTRRTILIVLLFYSTG